MHLSGLFSTWCVVYVWSNYAFFSSSFSEEFGEIQQFIIIPPVSQKGATEVFKCGLMVGSCLTLRGRAPRWAQAAAVHRAACFPSVTDAWEKHKKFIYKCTEHPSLSDPTSFSNIRNNSVIRWYLKQVFGALMWHIVSQNISTCNCAATTIFRCVCLLCTSVKDPEISD